MKQVSFTSPGSFQMDADEISRRQKLAEQLQAESMGPGPQGQMVGGWYVGPSWTQGLAHALKGVQGSYMRDKALKDRQELQGRMSAERSDTLARALAASKGAPASTETIMDETANGGMGQMANINAPAVQGDPMKAFGILAGSQDPSLAQAGTQALVSRIAPPNPLGNIAKLDPGHYSPESWAKYVQTGDTTHLRAIASPTAVLNADVNRERLAQKQREWASLSPMQLNQLQQKAAQLGISAQELFFNTGIRVDTPAAPGPTGPGAGPQASSPAPAPAPMPPGPQPIVSPQPDPQPTPQPVPPIQGGNRQQVMDMLAREVASQAELMKSPDPAIREVATKNYAEAKQKLEGMGARVNIPAPAQTSPGPAPAIITPKEAAKLRAEAPSAKGAMELTNSFADNLIASIDKAKKAKLSRVTGIMGVIPSIPGGAGADAQSLIDAVKSQVSLNTLQNMRNASKTGGAVGQVTEKEWPRLEAAVASLNQAQSEEQFRKALDDIRAVTERLKKVSTETYLNQYERLLSPGVGADGAALPTPAAGGLSPEEQAELEQLRTRLKK